MTSGGGGETPPEPPAEDATTPAEDASAPAEDAPAPAEDASTPAGGATPPTEGPAAEDVAAEPQAAAPAPAAPVPTVKGTITSLDGEEDALLTLEDGRAACIRKLDLADAQGKVSANVGDTIEAVVDTDHPAAEGAPVRLKRRSSPRSLALAALADSFATRTPLEGRVTSAIKGGYEVRLNGLRAFCPASQISLRRDDLTGDPVGQTLTFILSKYDPAGRSLVVSRRKLLEKAAKKAAAEAKTRLAEGARVTGTVVAFQPYGAFVDLGGVQGLLHVSEMSHSRIADPKALLQVGQSIEVQVLKHDPSFKKVSLSMKALVSDPWQGVSEKLSVGQVHRGRVRVAQGLGAFVEVLPGVEGLMSSADSQALQSMSPQPEDALVQIVDIDARRHRIALVRAPESAQPGDVIAPPAVEPGARIDGTVERIAAFGIFVRLAPGKTGLLHATESKTKPGTDLAKEFPIGSRVNVEILEISEDGQRIRLSCRTAAERAEAAAARSAAFERGPSDRPGAGPGGRGPSDRGERGERGPRREGGRDGRGHGGPGGPGGGRGDFRGPRRDGGGDRPRGPRRDGGERHENPAATKGRGFASFGDILREQLGDRLAPPAEAPAPTPASGETPESAE